MRKEYLLSRPACLGSDCLVGMFICSALEFAKSILNSQQHILPMLSDSNCYKGTQFRFCFARFVKDPIGPDVRLLILTQVGDLPLPALTRPSHFFRSNAADEENTFDSCPSKLSIASLISLLLAPLRCNLELNACMLPVFRTERGTSSEQELSNLP